VSIYEPSTFCSGKNLQLTLLSDIIIFFRKLIIVGQKENTIKIAGSENCRIKSLKQITNAVKRIQRGLTYTSWLVTRSWKI